MPLLLPTLPEPESKESESKKISHCCFAQSLLLLGVGLLYGLYGLTQHARPHAYRVRESTPARRKRAPAQELEKLNNRVEKVEDTSRKLAEKSGVVEQPNRPEPAVRAALDEMGLATLTAKMGRLEEDLRAYEAILRQRGYTPTVWPVEGTLEGGLADAEPVRRPGYEFHTGRTSKRRGEPGVAARAVSLFCWLAKRLRTTRDRRSRWRSDTATAPFAHRRRAQSNRRKGPITGQSRLNRPFDRTTPSLRSAHQRPGRDPLPYLLLSNKRRSVLRRIEMK
jgi:hypothetical protein